MIKRVDVAVYDAVKEVLENRFQGGFHAFGLDKNGVGYSMDEFNEALVPAALRTKVDESKAKIISGEIKVTDAMAAN
jgi:basic membrane protein A